MSLMTKRRPATEPRPKKNLTPIALQKELHGANGNGKPGPELRTAMRNGLLQKAAAMIYKKYPLNVEDLAKDPRTDTSVALTAAQCWRGANLEDRDSGLRLVGTDVGFDVSNPSGGLGYLSYEELLPAFRAAAFMGPDATATTTPAGIRANDPEARAAEAAGGLAAPAKANGKLKKPTLSLEREPVSANAYAGLIATRFSLGCFQRHPDNRHPLDAEVAALAEDLKANQQREPILARQLAGDKLQILWGEKRWLAAKQAGLPELWARVTKCDDVQALELVAQGNAQRSDFNPIDKAKLIEKLCQAGKTRAEAAAAVGLESDSAATNLVRLLQLPKTWAERVAAGELPESWARAMLPYLPLTPVMAELEKDWAKRDDPRSRDNAFESRAALVEQLAQSLEGYHSVCPRIDQSWWMGDRHRPVKIDAADPETVKKLGLVEVALPSGKKGTTEKVVVALNSKAYFARREAERAATEKRAAERSGREPKAKQKRELSPAEKKKQNADRARQLGERIRAWRHKLLRRACAKAIEDEQDSGLRIVLAHGAQTNLPYGTLTLGEALQEARGIKPSGESWQPKWWPVVAGIVSPAPPGREDDEETVVCTIAQVLLKHEAKDNRRPTLPFDLVEAYAADLGVDLAAEWGELQSSPPDPMLEEFFLLHQTEQLRELAKELGKFMPETATRAGMVKMLLAHRTRFKLPKSIKPAGKKGAK